MFTKSVMGGGKDLNADGVKPAAHLTRSVEEMLAPTTLTEVMTFVYGLALFRNHIPYFRELAAPLYDLWNEALASKKCKTTQAASKIKLCDLPGWEDGAKEAFEKVKLGLVEALAMHDVLRSRAEDLRVCGRKCCLLVSLYYPALRR